MVLSKFGIPGRNKHGKLTTAAKKAKKREHKRNLKALMGKQREVLLQQQALGLFCKREVENHAEHWVLDGKPDNKDSKQESKESTKSWNHEDAWMYEYVGPQSSAATSKSH